ncbi:Aspartate--tRNA ligase [Weissella viridescens]|uniref:Aspartate--tRNA ligase n=1 Tax=Weissella viridescens TaxID=1629 RepID=A0A380P902_WEIVI|nr:Aspartate--tRNA ligase [Weissella viridescens]
MKRTNYAGLIDEQYEGQTVVLDGWVQKRRDLGGLILLIYVTVKALSNWLSLMRFRKKPLK